MLARKLPRRTLFVVLAAALTLAACNVGAAPAPTTDLNAINTAALGTAMAQISAQQTQTALAAPSATLLPTNTALTLATFPPSTAAAASPTGNAGPPTVSFNTTPNTTPLAGFTPLASPVAPAATTSLGDACNNSAFEGDVTIPDGTVFKPGKNFVKVWKIRNTGTCTWDEGFTLVFIGGDRALDPYDFKFQNSDDFVDPGEAIDIGISLNAPQAEGKYQGTWRMQNDRGYYFGTLLSVYIEVKK